MVTYSFLDPIVFLAYRIPHLAHDQLPVLADYDYTHNLKLASFKVTLLTWTLFLFLRLYFSQHLDIFSGANKRHVFWGLMKVFRFEYIAMGVLVGLMVVASFVSPIGINRLLRSELVWASFPCQSHSDAQLFGNRRSRCHRSTMGLDFLAFLGSIVCFLVFPGLYLLCSMCLFLMVLGIL